MGRYGRDDYAAGYGWGRQGRREQMDGYGGLRRSGYDAGWRPRDLYDRPFRGYDGGSAYARAGWPVRGYDDARGMQRYGRRYDGGRVVAERGQGGDVDRIRVADIMTPNPEAVTSDASVAEIARRMRDLDVGVIPVVDDVDSFRLQGIVTDRDIAIRVAAEGKDVKKTSAGEIMTGQVQCVSENDHVRDVFEVMKRARVRRVPVTDAGGRLVGIVAQADLAVNYAGLDLQRETEVEEVIERISEPARPRWGREGAQDGRRRFGGVSRPGDHDADLPDRLRKGWRTLRREARQLIYDRGFRR